MKINVYVKVTNMLRILNGILKKFSQSKVLGGNDKKTSQMKEYMKIVTFSILWGIGGSFETSERRKLHNILKDRGFPVASLEGESQTGYDFDLRMHPTKNRLEWA
jgi:hypothetical protein